MGARAGAVALLAGLGLGAWGLGPELDVAAQTPLPAPLFHHLHLNSVNPDAAIEFYSKAVSTFPEYTEAKEGLKQVRGS